MMLKVLFLVEDKELVADLQLVKVSIGKIGEVIEGRYTKVCFFNPS